MGVNHAGLAKLNPPKAPVSPSPVVKSGSCRLAFFIQTAAELLFSTKQLHQKPKGVLTESTPAFVILQNLCVWVRTHTHTGINIYYQTLL